jgi:pimeloyl-ACP methyl ester carboxylesterase
MKNSPACLLIFIAVFLSGCSLSPAYIPERTPLQPGILATPNKSVVIPNLGPCTDSLDSELHFNSNYPITVLVHGCNGSAGRFRSLAQLYAFHGQQAVCFSYDDRDSLIDSSGQLITALDELAGHVKGQDVTVIGHSMGGLIARKAMENDRSDLLLRDGINIKLVTVSAPLSGIEVASPCGNDLLHWASLGIVPVSCWAVSGDNWNEITPQSRFIQSPRPLLSSVTQYLKIVTDERNTCRREAADGKCIEGDYIFSLPEQYHPIIDNYDKIINVEVKAGHVEIVGYKLVAPRKLLNILQQQKILEPTPPEHQAALERLLVKLY